MIDITVYPDLLMFLYTEVTIKAPFEFGQDVDDGYGDTSIGFLYNLNQENELCLHFLSVLTIHSYCQSWRKELILKLK